MRGGGIAFLLNRQKDDLTGLHAVCVGDDAVRDPRRIDAVVAGEERGKIRVRRRDLGQRWQIGLAFQNGGQSLIERNVIAVRRDDGLVILVCLP